VRIYELHRKKGPSRARVLAALPIRFRFPAVLYSYQRNMVRQYIPSTTKQIMVDMRRRKRPSAIAEDLACNPRTVQRVVKLARETGDVVRKPLVVGRPRVLNGVHLAVSYHFCSSFSLYLSYV
jgi:hypothetical protein